MGDRVLLFTDSGYRLPLGQSVVLYLGPIFYLMDMCHLEAM